MTELASRIRLALPRGGGLPDADWRRRHRLLLASSCGSALALAAFAAATPGDGVWHGIGHAAPVLLLAVLARDPRLGRKPRSALASLALLIAAASFVHLSGGLIEMHFTFFVLIVVLTLYEDWTPFSIAVAFVALHHGVLGTIEPQAVYDAPEQWAHPWRWAGIHAFFVSLAGAAAIATWRLNEAMRQRMLCAQRELADLAERDQLTRLGNRRKLVADLDAACAGEATVVLLDLDGFKTYNDTFGHPSGDALLRRLGSRLAEAMAPYDAVAYRLGGDEFCVLLRESTLDPRALAAMAAAALSESGDGFEIFASYGIASVPEEAQDGAEALRLADERMYARKSGSARSPVAQTTSALLQALAERYPGLDDHVSSVADLASAVAARLGIDETELPQLRYAADLHDIGKVAMPDSIIEKRGPLDEQEWELIRTHTLIGERIVGAAPALRGAARIVRATHERWDGTGYPDGLRGEEIPLAARIILVCDAYDAMTSDRCYRAALSHEEAMDELRRHAGTQFDPRVVAAFEPALADHRSWAAR